jgi:hypothetical protein
MGTIPIEPTSLTGSLPRGTTTAARPLVPEPAETLREDNGQAGGALAAPLLCHLFLDLLGWSVHGDD